MSFLKANDTMSAYYAGVVQGRRIAADVAKLSEPLSAETRRDVLMFVGGMNAVREGYGKPDAWPDYLLGLQSAGL